MTITIKEENKGIHQETSLRINAQINLLLQQSGITNYQPQSFTSLPTLLNIQAHLRTQMTDEAMSKIEGLVALYGALSSTSNATGFISVLTLYAKTHHSKSIITQLTTIAKDLFTDFTPQSSTDRPQWLDDMTNALHNWRLLTNSPTFGKISRVLSLLVTLGVIDRVSCNLGNFELFAVEAQNKQANAFDLVDALIDTVVFFAEGAYQCFQKGSLKPLLFNSSSIIELEEQFIRLTTLWEFARNGNLQQYAQTDEAQFDKELTDTIEKLSHFYKTMPNGPEKKIVQQKWEVLSKMQNEFIATRVTGGLRKSPFVTKIYGNSAMGKSTFADLTMATSLKAMGVPSSPEYIVTLDEKDKYMSAYRSYITGIKMDDYGNSKATFWETAPSDWIIKICNNIRQAAIMADLANKGKVTIDPRAMTITTNVEDLHAGITSNNPMSILRRCHIHVDLKVRPQFLTDNMLDSQKVLDICGSLDTINDIWLIDIKKPVGDGPGKQNFNSWEIIHKDMNIFDYLDFIAVHAQKHNKQQTSIVESFQDPASLIDFCPECNHIQQKCTCETEYEPHFGERIATTLKTKLDSSTISFKKFQLVAETRIEDFTVKALIDGYSWFWNSPYSSWTSYVPESWMDNDWIKMGILYAGQDWIGQEVQSYVYNYFLITLILTLSSSMVSYYFGSIVFCTALLYFFTCYAGVIEAKKNAYFNEIQKRRGVLPELFQNARDKHVQYACGAFASLALIYGVAQTVRAFRQTLSMQGSLQPASIAEIRERDTQINPWKQTAPVEETYNSYFANPSMINNRISKAFGQIFIDNKFSGAFAVATNVIAIPFHFLPSETKLAKIVLGKRPIKFLLNPELTKRVSKSDLVLIYVPNTGPLKDMTSFFNNEYITQPLQATLYGLDSSAKSFTSKIMWQFTPGVSNGPHVFNGAYYNLTGMNTFAGMCMSPIVSDTNRKGILGFHIGGVTNTSKGCGMAVLATDLKFTMHDLFKLSKTFVQGPQASDIDDVVAGKKILVSPDVHRKCPSNYISEESAVEVYGTVTRSNPFDSAVISTPISEIVEEVTGVKNQWGPPKFVDPIIREEDGHTDLQRWKPWFASLDVCSQPSNGFDPAHVEAAMDDYLFELKECFDKQKSLWSVDMKPLNNVEIVSGKDGVRFIDSMNSSTSMGYPIGGPKSNYLVDLEPTAENAAPRTFTPEIWALAAELEERADQGIFLNQIFGSSLKDEPTKLSKEKVRVFQAAPIALQILIRKYYLPVARFLSVNPLLAECAVGINSHGPEWHQLSEHMAKFGDDRIIAGDYAKYDLRMPEQLTLTAFATMIEIATWSGNYTAQDIKIMKAIAHDVCSPLVAYNGTLIRFMGTNPSGQNMTVYINSIVNSLLHRLAFFDAYSDEELDHIGFNILGLGRRATFRDLCALATYGDDAKGSVREGFDKFNHVSMANYLAANDIVFTMPDKESDPIPFMSRFKADFLKRKDLFNPDLGVYVGALDENSIFKSLHSIIKSKVVTPMSVSAMNLDGALREWFYHGPTIYENRREQVSKIALKANLAVPGLLLSYQDRVEAWREKYETQSGTVDISSDSDSVLGELEEVCAELQDMLGPDSAEEESSLPYIDLEERVIEVLGRPTLRNAIICNATFGEIDLLYECEQTILCIECKIVRDGPAYHTKRATSQARKYARVFKTLRPDCTVYGLICTEFGFTIVTCLGKPKFPKKFAALLDSVPMAS